MTLDTRPAPDGAPSGMAASVWRASDGCADLEVDVVAGAWSVDVTDVTEVVPVARRDTGCAGREGATEAYAETLADVDRWQLDGDLLVLRGPAMLAWFEPAEVAPPPPGLVAPEDADLWERTWTATEVTVDGDPVAPVGDVPLTVTLDRSRGQSRLGFSAGCNAHGGLSWVTPETLTLVDGMSTEIGCLQPLHDEDRASARFFGHDVAWHLDGDELTLRAADTVIELVADDADGSGPR